jgi:hypothetical protein
MLTVNSMFFHLLYIHLFRPFLKYNPSTSPLPAHVSPRKICTQAASQISKLMRLYKRTYGLRQICNIAVYMVHSACTVHLLNLPEKTAQRDIVHGVKHLEEIAGDWLCARRTLSILSVLARKWNIELPKDAETVLARTDAKFGVFSTADVPSPLTAASPPASSPPPQAPNLNSSDFYINQGPSPVSPRGAANTTIPNNLTDTLSMGTSNQPPQGASSKPLPMVNTPMSFPPDNAIPMASAYSVRHYSMAPPQVTATPMDPLSGVSSTTATRQTSPSVMFGGVDALMESQDWWLRDQASLAVGFENWNGLESGDGIPGGRPGEFNTDPSMGGTNGTGFDDMW